MDAVRIGILGLAIAALTGGAATAAETGTAESAPVCKRAEVNPITGHVLCLDPLGAAVEAPPEELKPACDPDQPEGEFVWKPNCVRGES